MLIEIKVANQKDFTADKPTIGGSFERLITVFDLIYK
jgi:hypothetical protein